MKKFYMQPSTVVVEILTESFIAESLAVQGNAGNKTQLSRESNWTDED